MPRPMIAIAATAVALCCGASAGRAQTYGDAPWCAVLEETNGEVIWQCYYRTVEECRPNVVAGSRGFCNVNPYWRGTPPAPSRIALSPRHHWHHARRHHAR